MKKVFCWGTFDKLHEGHLAFLKDAKSQGDLLYVIVIADKSVYENKSKSPTQTQSERSLALKETGIVDEVIEVSKDLDSNLEKIALLKPDIFVFGYDQQTDIETDLKNYLKSKGLNIVYYVSKEFANGIHSSKV